MESLKQIINNIELLEELENNPQISQQKLSKKLNVSVGLINLFIKRLTKKGLLKIKRINGKSLAYLLTPSAITEKARLTKEYMQSSMTHYKNARIILKNEFLKLKEDNINEIIVLSTLEWAEISYITASELNIEIKGFIIENNSEIQNVCNIPVLSKEHINNEDDIIIGIGKIERQNKFNVKYIFETDFEGIS